MKSWPRVRTLSEDYRGGSAAVLGCGMKAIQLDNRILASVLDCRGCQGSFALAERNLLDWLRRAWRSRTPLKSPRYSNFLIRGAQRRVRRDMMEMKVIRTAELQDFRTGSFATAALGEEIAIRMEAAATRENF